MAVGIRVRVRGAERFAEVLEDLEPKKNPELVRLAFLDAEEILLEGIRGGLTGPRPRRARR